MCVRLGGLCDAGCIHILCVNILCVLDWVDFVMLAAYIFYQVCFFVFPVRTIIHHQLPTASAVVVVSEQVRRQCLFK